MYYIIYPILYLLSLLPFFIIYSLGDFFYVLMYYVFGYRKEIVMGNIAIAFPEKSVEERKLIAKQFYKNFINTLIETIKMISMSNHEFEKRCTIDMASSIELVAKGKSITFVCGHQMNWEYGNWILAKNSTIPFIGIYQKIGNKALNKLFYNLRARYNTVLVSTNDFKHKKDEILVAPYSIALAADQNGNPDSCYWLYFFSKPAPFVTGPAKGAIKNNTAVVFAHFRIRKKGHYHFDTTVIAENANEFSPEELTLRFRDLLEQTIKESPDNYLWSHRRWRHNYSEKYSHLWIDTKQP